MRPWTGGTNTSCLWNPNARIISAGACHSVTISTCHYITINENTFMSCEPAFCNTVYTDMNKDLLKWNSLPLQFFSSASILVPALGISDLVWSANLRNTSEVPTRQRYFSIIVRSCTERKTGWRKDKFFYTLARRKCCGKHTLCFALRA
jgi:hypothetical protein